MIQICNFKDLGIEEYGTLPYCLLQRPRHRHDSGVVCVGEENCVLFQIYKLLEELNGKKTQAEGTREETR